MTDLGIVIVNYKTPALLRDCLRSVFDSEGDLALRVCVVDNASGDDSAAMVRRDFPPVHLIEQPTNQGYAAANNAGLRWFGFRDGAGEPTAPDAPRYALLLNPDTLLPPTALNEMVQFMEARPSCGVAGPRLVRRDGSLDRACRRSFPSPEVSFYRLTGLSFLLPRSRRFGRYNLTYLDDTVSVELDSVVGAFMMVRRAALRDAGLLDEQFFMYGEDLDLAFRIKAAGWRIWYNAAVTVLHYKGEASKQRSAQSIFHFYDAMRLFHQKHYAATAPAAFNWLIQGGIWSLYTLALARNALRPRARRGVASAV